MLLRFPLLGGPDRAKRRDADDAVLPRLPPRLPPGQEAPAGPEGAEPPDAAPAPATAPTSRKTRAGTKQAQLISMLERPEGVTIAEVVAATGWQPHTVRGAIAGALKKRLGLNVVSEKIGERGRVYRIKF